MISNHVDTQFNRGSAALRDGELFFAEMDLAPLYTNYPDQPKIAVNYGLLKLLKGDLGRGFDMLTWRRHDPDKVEAFKNYDTIPVLNALSEIRNRRVFLWNDQGIGDQFRDLSMVRDLMAFSPAEMILECNPKVRPLIERSFPDCTVVSLGDRISDIDFQSTYLDLNRLFRRGWPSFLANCKPWLQAAPQEWGESDFVVGLSWRSDNPDCGAAKSLSIADLEPILKVPGVRFVDLQGVTSAELQDIIRTGADFRTPVYDPKQDIDDLAATIKTCDLVISSSNTVAHLAGALGVQTSVLLPKGPGLFWYWFLGRHDSPFYPAARLYRQKTPGDWSAPVAEAAAALRKSWS